MLSDPLLDGRVGQIVGLDVVVDEVAIGHRPDLVRLVDFDDELLEVELHERAALVGAALDGRVGVDEHAHGGAQAQLEQQVDRSLLQTLVVQLSVAHVVRQLVHLLEQQVHVAVVLRQNVVQVPVDARHLFANERVVDGHARYVSVHGALHLGRRILDHVQVGLQARVVYILRQVVEYQWHQLFQLFGQEYSSRREVKFVRN